MLAVVIAGGEFTPSRRAISLAHEAELVIAADSGARHLAALGRRADVCIGDFDSYTPFAGEAGTVLSFPATKDLTDTHLALRETVSRGADRVVLLAALRGPRIDHALANVQLLAAEEFAVVDLRIIDGDDELRLVRDCTAIHGSPGDLVSLLPLTPAVDGISTEGLMYALQDASLRLGESRGLSNLMSEREAKVSVSGGLLLLVHREGGDPNNLGVQP